jgi:hypothetical protein
MRPLQTDEIGIDFCGMDKLIGPSRDIWEPFGAKNINGTATP